MLVKIQLKDTPRLLVETVLQLTQVFFLLWMTFLPLSGIAQNAEAEPAKEADSSTVTVVYGVTADDYLPVQESARQHLRPKVRRSSSHPDFDLPDAFYFIGGPIFLLILLRILVTFLDDFEERRKEEQRQAASEEANVE